MTLVKSNVGLNPWRFNDDYFLDVPWPSWPARRDTLPAVNVQENDKNYIVEVIARVLKKRTLT